MNAIREIIILSMRFVNFKGLRDLTIKFPGKDIDISGENGLGKSSIFDGFTWVLFGKDRNNREKFNIKTVDANNNVIPRLPHEVEIELLVDGEHVRLTRRYNEVWTKKKGCPEEKFTGHEQERLYNDVPCTEAEWSEKINELCSEQVFKFITNPLYFCAQKTDVQREMLIKMAGGVSDAEVAAGNSSFTKLLADITGKTLAEYQKEIKAKKKRIEANIKPIPGQIKERRRDVVEAEDWSELKAQRTTLTSQRDLLQKQLSDSTETIRVNNQRRVDLMNEINKLSMALKEAEYAVSLNVSKEYREQQQKHNELEFEYKSIVRRIENYIREKESEQSSAERCAEIRKQYIAEYNRLLNESDALVSRYNTAEPQLSDEDFRCPTCGHQYDIDRIDEIQNNALIELRKSIQKEMDANARSIEENKRNGAANTAKMQSHETAVSLIEAKIAENQKRLAEIEEMPLYKNVPVAPDAAPAIEADEKCVELRNIIKSKQDELNSLSERTADDTNSAEIEEKINAISKQLEGIAVRLAKKDIIAQNEKRIADLEEELRNGSNELTELEGIEFTIAAFTKARINKVEDKINSLFSLVRFKMFETQINGGEQETCQAMIEGVPFYDLNDAKKINAGLDIINAICKYHGIYAPIFMDNAEGVNHPISTKSQRIRLIVTKEPELNIKQSDNTPTLF